MYQISDQQIDYMLEDIRARGIGIESLRLNLLDHICIIIEQNLGENGDFELFYANTLKAFYKQDLREIEEETVLLLTRKNYYIMKKTMIISGAFSAAAFICSSFCKIWVSHLTDFLMFLGFISFVFLFLPLMFIVKIRETTIKQDKLILASGSIAGVLYFFCMLLKFLGPNWPNFLGPAWPNMQIIWLTLWLIALAIAFFVFIPAYFFAGIRKPETKTNTIAISILLVAFMGVQFRFTNLVPLRQSKQPTAIQDRQSSSNTKQHAARDVSGSASENNKAVLARVNL
jgi:hypothetical protein